VPGYARRDRTLTLNAGNDAEGAWIALNKPELADDAAQRVALEFNKEQENANSRICPRPLDPRRPEGYRYS
jgi:hypothetical protein